MSQKKIPYQRFNYFLYLFDKLVNQPEGIIEFVNQETFLFVLFDLFLYFSL